VSKESLRLGKAGEERAAGLLRENGYRILATNYKTKFAEIDIIAKDKDTICFVEVKTRSQDSFGEPKEAVTAAKQRKIYLAALQFLKEKNSLDSKARFDVVSILDLEGKTRSEIIKNAFECEG
jgi:putative endonuclease